MIPSSTLYSPKFGIRLDANTPLRPSRVSLLLFLGLHIGACFTLWCLNGSYLLCFTGSFLVTGMMFFTIQRSIFSITRYQLHFFFEDKSGWVIQENENTCYRAVLRYAFCSNYLVILIFQNKAILPIFFDSLPANQFRQLRKVLILLDYV